MEETHRQKKISGVIQEDLAKMLQEYLRQAGVQGILISVSKVFVTVDLSLAKVYVSIFPSKEAIPLVNELNEMKSSIKHQLSQLVKHQLRKTPDLHFYNDDSLEYIEKIESAVKGTENPIKNPELLHKRKNK